jgi:hypothetical protein
MKHYNLKKLFPGEIPALEGAERLIVLSVLFGGELGVYVLPGDSGVLYHPARPLTRKVDETEEPIPDVEVDAAIRDAIRRGLSWRVRE